MAGEDLSVLHRVWESQVLPSLRDDRARTEESEVPRPSRAEVLHYLLDKTGAIRERYREVTAVIGRRQITCPLRHRRRPGLLSRSP